MHILECIARIQEYVAEGRESFLGSTLIQDAVMRNLQILGESARRLSDRTRARGSEVDWQGIIGFRNVIVRDYLGITLGRVWEVVELDVPILAGQIEEMLRSLDESP